MEGKRPLPKQAGAEPKRARIEAGQTPAAGPAQVQQNPENIKKMLIKGLLRVLHACQTAGKLPVNSQEIPQLFLDQWKVALTLESVGETCVANYLKQFPAKVVVTERNGEKFIDLTPEEKGKAQNLAAKAGAPAAGPAAAAAAAGAPKAGQPASSTPVPPPKAPSGAAAGRPLPQREGGPCRPPGELKDFLWHLHGVLAAFTQHCGGPFPLQDLQGYYSHYMGHKLGVERFLVVQDQTIDGLAATLKRIPHVVKLKEANGAYLVTNTLPAGISESELLEKDEEYKKNIINQAKAAGRAGAAASTAKPLGAPPKPKLPTNAPPRQAPAAAPAAAVTAPAPTPAPAAAGPGGVDAAQQLERMLLQGLVKVVTTWEEANQGPLPVANLHQQFQAVWNVPFKLEQVWTGDVVEWLSKWPQKVEVVPHGDHFALRSVRRGVGKAGAARANTAKPGVPRPPPPPAPAPKAPASEADRRPAAAAAGVAVKHPVAVKGGGTAAPPVQRKDPLDEALALVTQMQQQIDELQRKQQATLATLQQLKASRSQT